MTETVTFRRHKSAQGARKAKRGWTSAAAPQCYVYVRTPISGSTCGPCHKGGVYIKKAECVDVCFRLLRDRDFASVAALGFHLPTYKLQYVYVSSMY